MLYEFELDDSGPNPIEVRVDMEQDRIQGGCYPADYEIRSILTGDWVPILPTHPLYPRVVFAIAEPEHRQRIAILWLQWIAELYGRA